MEKPGLSALLWRYRVLLVFAPQSSGRPDLPAGFADYLSGVAEELLDRLLLVYSVTLPDGLIRRIAPGDDSPPIAGGSSDRDDTDPPHLSSDGLIGRFRPDFDTVTVVLIGKDGGEKLRRRAPCGELEPLVAIVDSALAHIDTMPMRRREMHAARR